MQNDDTLFSFFLVLNGNNDLGVIKIYDNYSTVDILNQKGKKFLNDYKEIIVKNKKAKIREEK